MQQLQTNFRFSAHQHFTSPIEVTEKLMKVKLSIFLSYHKILYKYRSVFSTKTAMLKVIADLQRNIDVNILLLLCFSKAFDYVCWDILFLKLNCLGFSETAEKIVKSYLNERSPITNELYSETIFLSSGVF